MEDTSEHIAADVREAVAAAMRKRDQQFQWTRRDAYQIAGIVLLLFGQLLVAGNYIKGVEQKVALNAQAISSNTQDRYTAARAQSDFNLRDERIGRSLELAAESKALVKTMNDRAEMLMQQISGVSAQVAALQATLEERRASPRP